MAKTTIASLLLLAAFPCMVSAQDSQKETMKDSMAAPRPATVITASADAYYRYDFNAPKDARFPNNLTSFTRTHNSFELGMASVKAEHTTGKVGMVADLGFGRRAEEFAYNDANTRLAIKQLYITFAPSSKIKFTLGSWATHVGYELVDPYLNRNYSMSYMFTNGPFTHTGIKADISLGGKTNLMVGVSNPIDFRTAFNAPKTFLGQLSTASKDDKMKAYLNFVGGKQGGDRTVTQGDVVVTYAASAKFSLGYNGTYQHREEPVGFVNDVERNWWGSALYLNFDPITSFGLTARVEYINDDDEYIGVKNVIAPTLSANFKVDNLIIIPEVRFESAKNQAFLKADGTGSKSTGSFILAAVYRFNN